ncbi:3-deoxy-D-manno-octulosonic acid kinase [Ursidibacter arcticus]|uniref:3-deoxy-D-manno-octulosonic acid kinase n=1 Tax=Ursidibacter arcticus TaxID=1524965 RepID=UPI0012FADC9A|nr:3-deoxy-D-manno-octulosonic acid kinase [Ursidibacter arcticus]KAE9537053.1 3-deoxy-D-manno-octulosonic acid kinase [Ursidibacter arcticus]
MRYCQFNPDIVPLAQHTFVEQLLNCKDFTKSDRLLGSSKGRGTTWFINTTAELGINSVLRHYYRGGIFGKLVKDRYFFTHNENTRAVQEFNLLGQLVQWGLPVPRPIACQITRQFFCYQADILLEKIANTQDLSQYLQKNQLTKLQYAEIGRLIRQLHAHQVHHSDLNIHNILIDNQGKFWLIDFDKCKIQIGCSWKQKNLDRLHRSFLKEQTRLGILFNEQDWQMLLDGYAK